MQVKYAMHQRTSWNDVKAAAVIDALSHISNALDILQVRISYIEISQYGNGKKTEMIFVLFNLSFLLCAYIIHFIVFISLNSR